jgi:hypothetical protein
MKTLIGFILAVTLSGCTVIINNPPVEFELTTCVKTLARVIGGEL